MILKQINIRTTFFIFYKKERWEEYENQKNQKKKPRNCDGEPVLCCKQAKHIQFAIAAFVFLSFFFFFFLSCTIKIEILLFKWVHFIQRD
jgi:hypothetical protein